MPHGGCFISHRPGNGSDFRFLATLSTRVALSLAKRDPVPAQVLLNAPIRNANSGPFSQFMYLGYPHVAVRSAPDGHISGKAMGPRLYRRGGDGNPVHAPADLKAFDRANCCDRSNRHFLRDRINCAGTGDNAERIMAPDCGVAANDADSSPRNPAAGPDLRIFEPTAI